MVRPVSAGDQTTPSGTPPAESPNPAGAATPPPSQRTATGLIRWSAVLPMGVLLGVILIVGWFFLDTLVRRAIEAGGTAAVGAKVDVARARVRVRGGEVRVNGLEVTDPDAPMRNLIEAEEIVVDLGLRAALEGKVVIDTMAARGLRFGTPRRTSGALPAPEGPVAPESPGAMRQVVDAWLAEVRVPPLDLSTLTRTVNVGAISAESLATVRAARETQSYVDTVEARFKAGLRAADPRPSLDSAEALLTRLRGADLRSLGLAGARTAVRDIRRTITDLQQIDDRFKAFERGSRASIDTLGQRVRAVGAARTTDYAYARSLVQLPTVEIPAIGPQLFEPVIAEKVGALMYWMEVAERYVPPGLKRQLRAGPSRVRASGTDVLFPVATTAPTFLARVAELSLAIGGADAAAGAYLARLEGVTTQPAVYGAPTTFEVRRTAAAVGPRDIRIRGSLDHRTVPVKDRLEARLVGVPLPTLPLGGLGGTVALGDGLSLLDVARTGDSWEGRWLWRTTAVRWARDTVAQPPSTNPRTRLVEDALWRALARIDSVEIEARFTGEVRRPRLRIRTNIADAVAAALEAQVGDEVRRAEQEIRGRVDALVGEAERRVRTEADRVKGQAESRLAEERARLDAQRAALEKRLRELIRIPGLG